MKNLLYIFIMAMASLSCSIAFAAGDDWKIIFLTDKEANTHTGVEFHKNGKKAFEREGNGIKGSLCLT